SIVSKKSLENSLHQLECHFTWYLPKEDVDLEDLEEKIVDWMEFLKANATNYNLLSYVCYLNNSEEKALRNLQKAEEEVQKNNPDDISRRSLVTWGNYAWIYYHMKKYEDAQTYVSKVEDSCKKLSSTAERKIQLPEIYAEQGWALLTFGKKYYERAKKCFENALRNEPDNPEFNTGYAITMYRLEDHSQRHSEDASLSLKPLKRAMKLDPEHVLSMVLLALKLQDLNRVDEGEGYIEEAMQKNPDLPYVLRYAGKFYRRKGEEDKAIEILNKALNMTPSAFLHHQLGLCYRGKLGKLKQARYPPQDQVNRLIHRSIFHFKTAIEKKSKFFSAYLDLALMYAEEKRYEEAEEAFCKAYQINILSISDKQEFYLRYGNFHNFYKKLHSEAIKYYLEGMKIEKDTYYFHKCKTALKKLLERRIQRGVGDATDFAILGFVHKLNGEKHEAIKCYEKAVALCPDNEEYLNALCELQLSI
ncbi:IFIT5 protein, partial [Alcedo cyanopectus]|nr:IFIT5 protein [Ceyx cyanopectus]